VGYDRQTGQLLLDEPIQSSKAAAVPVILSTGTEKGGGGALIGARGVVLRCDLADAHLAVCSPDLINVFQDEVDYRHLRSIIRKCIKDDVQTHYVYAAVLDRSPVSDQPSTANGTDPLAATMKLPPHRFDEDSKYESVFDFDRPSEVPEDDEDDEREWGDNDGLYATDPHTHKPFTKDETDMIKSVRPLVREVLRGCDCEGAILQINTQRVAHQLKPVDVVRFVVPEFLKRLSQLAHEQHLPQEPGFEDWCGLLQSQSISDFLQGLCEGQDQHKLQAEICTQIMHLATRESFSYGSRRLTSPDDHPGSSISPSAGSECLSNVFHRSRALAQMFRALVEEELIDEDTLASWLGGFEER